MKRISTYLSLLLCSCFFFLLSCSNESIYYVSLNGNDQNSGSEQQPFATISKALEAASSKKGQVNIIMRGGTYYLTEPVIFTGVDSRTEKSPLLIKAASDEKVVISGAVKLDNLKWQAYSNGIMQTSIADDVVFDQLFVNGQLQHMARYPNFDLQASHYNGTDSDAIAPERVANWANPKDGYIHALHRYEWGGYHWQILGKNENNELELNGGYQNNRLMGMHKQHRFVENIFEELDSPGEWYYDSLKKILYFYPPTGMELSTATIEVPQLKELFIFKGSRENPVKHISIEGLEITQSLRTFMYTKEKLLRSDWAIYRGGAVFMENAEYCAIKNCYFNAVGGNAVFFSNYNRHNEVSGCHIENVGASGVCFVGDPAAVRSPLFEYNERNIYEELDLTPGPKTDNYPAECLVYNNLMHDLGRVEKQIAGVQISMAQDITISHNSIYNLPRSGINISEGTWGGHVIEFNDVFNTVLETGDHGSFNSWGRDRFWHPNRDSMDIWTARNPDIILLDAVKTTYIRNNRFRCDHGWDIDLDDGSSNYYIANNVCLNGGLKLREGFYRTVVNNIMINNSFHPHVWFANSGDVFRHNIVMAQYIPIRVDDWGKEVDYNVFPDEISLEKVQANGTDKHSVFGSPEFSDPNCMDYEVKETSIALTVGFKNFDMDNFGVKSPQLKALAKTPIVPKVEGMEVDEDEIQLYMGMRLKNVTTLGDRSAAGLSETSGVSVVDVQSGSKMYDILKSGDVIISFNNSKVKDINDLKKAFSAAKSKSALVYVRNQKNETITVEP